MNPGPYPDSWSVHNRINKEKEISVFIERTKGFR